MKLQSRRIAYVCSDAGVPVFGSKGCSVHVQEMIRALRRQGATITLFAQRRGGAPPKDLDDMSVHSLPRFSKQSTAIRERNALEMNEILRGQLEALGPFDLVYERYSLWGYAGMGYASERHIPGILEVNAPLIEEQREHRSLVHETEAEKVAQRVFEDASSLIAISRPVADYLSIRTGAFDKIHVIPNGVDPNRFTPNNPPAYPGVEGSFTVGFVGTLKPWHGMTDLVEAFAVLRRQAPNSRLLIVGDGPERSTIESLLATHGLQQAAHITGMIPPEEVPRFIASMDVGVAPYPRMESCYFSPLKLFEYMASGVAVVGSDIGQLSELITHEKDGLLYPPGDTFALAHHLLSLHKDDETRRRLARAGRQTVLRSHTWDAVAARIGAIAGPHFVKEVS